MGTKTVVTPKNMFITSLCLFQRVLTLMYQICYIILILLIQIDIRSTKYFKLEIRISSLFTETLH